MPIIAQSGPIQMNVGQATPTTPVTPITPVTPTQPTGVTGLFVLKHGNFINQVRTLDRCFAREDIRGFTPDELEDHLAVAVQDNFVVEDGDSNRFCDGQVAWRLKERTKGYVYERL